MNEILEQNFYRDSFSICYGAEILTLRKVDQKYLSSFENCSWRRTEVKWTNGVKNEVLQQIKKESSIYMQ
jgi:hypothetical protein